MHRSHRVYRIYHHGVVHAVSLAFFLFGVNVITWRVEVVLLLLLFGLLFGILLLFFSLLFRFFFFRFFFFRSRVVVGIQRL